MYTGAVKQYQSGVSLLLFWDIRSCCQTSQVPACYICTVELDFTWTSAFSQTDLPIYLLSCPCIYTVFFMFPHLIWCLINIYISTVCLCCKPLFFFPFSVILLLYRHISFLHFHVDILQWECFLVLARTQRFCTTSHHCWGWEERDSLVSEKKGMASDPKSMGCFQTLFIVSRFMLSIFVCGSLPLLYTCIINIVAVTVHFLLLLLSPVICSYLSPWFAFCAPYCGGGRGLMGFLVGVLNWEIPFQNQTLLGQAAFSKAMKLCEKYTASEMLFSSLVC